MWRVCVHTLTYMCMSVDMCVYIYCSDCVCVCVCLKGSKHLCVHCLYVCVCDNNMNNVVKHLAAFIRVVYRQCTQSYALHTVTHKYSFFSSIHTCACIILNVHIYCSCTRTNCEWELFTGMCLVLKHTQKSLFLAAVC